MRLAVGSTLLALTALACSGGGESGPAEGPGAPPLLPPAADLNVIVVSFDALRADALGVYGYELPTSPRIDEFAARSLVFDRAYAAAPVTPTSFAGAFTGQAPHKVFRGWRLAQVPTVAEVFRNAGYRTAAFLNNSQLTPERDFDQGFEEYSYRVKEDPELLGQTTAWLDGDTSGKFFLWVHFLSPHSPYTSREISQQFYDPAYSGLFEESSEAEFETDDPVEIRRLRSLYDGEVFWADILFGRLLDALEERDLLARSLVILTSDHGEEFKERGGFQHRFLYDETVRIPLLIFHPSVEHGARTAVLASNMDLLPSLASLAGLPAPDGLDGRNVLTRADDPVWVVSEAMTDAKYRGVALLEGTKKLIMTCHPEQRLELYDLMADPEEDNDLRLSNRESVMHLRRRLLAFFGNAPCAELEAAVSGQPPTQNLSSETIEELRALGYLD